jgi:hypothetical protein
MATLRVVVPPELAFPRDASGFVRRRCAGCKRAFKVRWTHADGALLLRALCSLVRHFNAGELGPPLARFCPYCSHSAQAEGYWTDEQRSFLEEQAGHLRGEVRYFQLRHVEDRLGDNPYITFVLVRPPPPEAAELPAEPDDMRVFHLVCCGEPVKLQGGWTGRVTCHFCKSVHALE